jgi:hypothetical protein
MAQHIAPHAVGQGVPNAKLPDGSMNRRQHFHRRFDGTAVAWGYALPTTYDDASWAPSSGNSWWHDRPDRAYPRWVQEQRHREGPCDPARMWWSGTGWHC